MAVLLRDGGSLSQMPERDKLEMDHIVPVSKGARPEESNLQTSADAATGPKSRKLVPRFLKMSAAGESSRSIAVELALLFLREL